MTQNRLDDIRRKWGVADEIRELIEALEAETKRADHNAALLQLCDLDALQKDLAVLAEQHRKRMPSINNRIGVQEHPLPPAPPLMAQPTPKGE